MKKIITILISLSSLFSMAQPNTNVMQYDSIYRWRWNPELKNWDLTSKNLNTTTDSNNNRTHYITQILNNNNWENSKQKVYIYDSNNNLINTLFQNWNGTEWVNAELNTYTYDSNNNRTIHQNQKWDQSDWINNTLVEYTYDSNNNPINILYKTFADNAYINNENIKYYYDQSNNVVNAMIQHWYGDKWRNTDSTINTYNAENQLINKLNLIYDRDSFYTDYEYFYKYDSNKNMVLENLKLSSDQFFESIIYNTYDENNNLTGYIRFYEYRDDWNISEKETITYDENNHKTGIIFEEWETNQWIKRSFKTFHYNSNNILTNYSTIGFNPDGTIPNGDSIAYYLSTTPSSKSELAETTKAFEVFPNPNNGKFTIRSDKNFHTVEVFNLNGVRLFYRSNLDQMSDYIELPENFKGFCIIKVDNNGIITTKKLLVGY